VGCAVNVFSPLAINEMRRVIARGGHFIMAIPGEEHLFGLKAAIYDTPYKNAVEDTAIEGFRLVGQKTVRYPLVLDTQERIRALFMMTPYAYRTSEAGRARVMSLDSLECEAHFIILVYEREE
jgi:23S rRNA (guanine745-N1)-methyltransferase